mmetsp:Transcript_20028/g.64858  ORF Transcript_20028/g.64858 Transcript_20028/m.64858 type:complete len:230 (-) Transcript_20028:272-961(-)
MAPVASASTSAPSSTAAPRPRLMNTAVFFIAANSGPPQKSRVACVPGREHTTKSDRLKTSSLSSTPKVAPGAGSPSAAALSGSRRHAIVFIPKASASRADVLAMWPQPTKPMVLPARTSMVKASQCFQSRFLAHRGSCLLKWSAAASTYSASELEKAPRPLLRGVGRAARASDARNGARPSTPALKEWTQFGPSASNAFVASAPATPGTQTSASSVSVCACRLAASPPR